MSKKIGFFQRLTGGVDVNPEEGEKELKKTQNNNWIEEENDEAELAIDVYQTPSHIILQTMVAGVKPENLEISITRTMFSIKGERGDTRIICGDDYFAQELYWGKFSRSVLLPQEVEPEETEATEKHGLLTVKLRKIDKEKKSSVKVKSL
ncbi:MAG: Hsp20/alpha crystallin family protein [Patescibacteria group bacterium]